MLLALLLMVIVGESTNAENLHVHDVPMPVAYDVSRPISLLNDSGRDKSCSPQELAIADTGKKYLMSIVDQIQAQRDGDSYPSGVSLPDDPGGMLHVRYSATKHGFVLLLGHGRNGDSGISDLLICSTMHVATKKDVKVLDLFAPTADLHAPLFYSPHVGLYLWAE